MQALFFVFVLGSALNAATPTPHSVADFNAQWLAQWSSPTIVADYSNLNK